MKGKFITKCKIKEVLLTSEFKLNLRFMSFCFHNNEQNKTLINSFTNFV